MDDIQGTIVIRLFVVERSRHDAVPEGQRRPEVPAELRQPPMIPEAALLPQGQSLQPAWSPPSPLHVSSKERGKTSRRTVVNDSAGMAMGLERSAPESVSCA